MAKTRTVKVSKGRKSSIPKTKFLPVRPPQQTVIPQLLANQLLQAKPAALPPTWSPNDPSNLDRYAGILAPPTNGADGDAWGFNQPGMVSPWAPQPINKSPMPVDSGMKFMPISPVNPYTPIIDPAIPREDAQSRMPIVRQPQDGGMRYMPMPNEGQGNMPIQRQPLPTQGKPSPQPRMEFFDSSYTPQAGSINDSEFTGYLGAPIPSNPITQTFGQKSQYDSFSGGVNYGVDYRSGANTPVRLPKGNYKVVDAFYGAKPDSGYLGNGTNSGYGNSVLVQDMNTGEKFRFSHLNKVAVKPGQTFQGGEIGLTGSTGNVTGPHLDMEYYDKTGKMADITKTPYASMMWQNQAKPKPSMPTVAGANTMVKKQPSFFDSLGQSVQRLLSPKQVQAAERPAIGTSAGNHYQQLSNVEKQLNKQTQQPKAPIKPPANPQYPKQIPLPKKPAPAVQSVMNAVIKGGNNINKLFSGLFK